MKLSELRIIHRYLDEQHAGFADELFDATVSLGVFIDRMDSNREEAIKDKTKRLHELENSDVEIDDYL